MFSLVLSGFSPSSRGRPRQEPKQPIIPQLQSRAGRKGHARGVCFLSPHFLLFSRVWNQPSPRESCCPQWAGPIYTMNSQDNPPKTSSQANMIWAGLRARPVEHQSLPLFRTHHSTFRLSGCLANLCLTEPATPLGPVANPASQIVVLLDLAGLTRSDSSHLAE